jgi:hypothetical protein
VPTECTLRRSALECEGVIDCSHYACIPYSRAEESSTNYCGGLLPAISATLDYATYYKHGTNATTVARASPRPSVWAAIVPSNPSSSLLSHRDSIAHTCLGNLHKMSVFFKSETVARTGGARALSARATEERLTSQTTAPASGRRVTHKKPGYFCSLR